jgi:uncharacterized protein YaiI (UPF0178 family)
MHIWVDADACPGTIKEILFRAADRVRIQVTLVANQALRIPPSHYIRFRQVLKGPDLADQRIVAEVADGDLVISADIPLAADAIARGAVVLSPHGELYDAHNIGQALTMRNFMDQLRSGGVDTGGPAPFSQADARAFARQLERQLARHVREAPAAE